MINQILFLLIFCSNLFFISNLETCTIPSTGIHGNCMPISQCPLVQNELKNDRTKTAVICDRKLRTICCPTQLSTTRDAFDSEGLPESYNQPVTPEYNQQFLRLNQACTGYRDKMKKNLTISSFIIGEPATVQKASFCNTNQRDIGVALENEFPHVAYIHGMKTITMRRGRPVIPPQLVADTKCSGSLITENFVLTTVVCVSNIRHSSAIVHFGILNLTSEFEAHTKIEVSRYDVQSLGEISLLNLPRKMEISENLVPACLSSVSNNKFILTGWTGYRYECNPLLKKWYIKPENVIEVNDKLMNISSDYIINYHESLLLGSPLHIYHPENECQYIIKGLFKRIHLGKYEFWSIERYLPWIETTIFSTVFK